jgi:hypothetical protein
MRRLAVVAVLVLGLAACGGGSGASKRPLKITLGLSGGSIRPYSVTIAPDGAVTETGAPPAKPTPLTSAQEAKLSAFVRSSFPNLKSKRCKGMFVTALGRTVTVAGGCDPGFTKLWDKLTAAVGTGVAVG